MNYKYSLVIATVLALGICSVKTASAGTVTVDGIKKAGEYTGADANTSSGFKSLLWWNDHHSIYTKAAGNTNPLHWEINKIASDSFSLNVFFEVPTYARRMIWEAGTDYGPGDFASYEAAGGKIPKAYLDAYLDGSHHGSVKMDYDTQTKSEYFGLNDKDGSDGSIVKIKWQAEDTVDDDFTWATSREYLINEGLATTSESLNFDVTASIELMWTELASESAAETLRDSITEMQLHLSDEARGLPPIEEDPKVPEPTSLAIFGLGTLCMGLGAARRRRKEKENSV